LDVWKYADDMLADRWYLTHQGVAFDEIDLLKDGFHRLHAIILADKTRPGITVAMRVTRQVAATAFPGMDVGRGRTAADLLSIYRKENTSQLAAVGRRVLLWQADKPWSGKTTASRVKVAESALEIPGLDEAAKFAHAWKDKQTLSPAMAAFAWWLFVTSGDREDADYFMGKLGEGGMLETTDPIHVLRERLKLMHGGEGTRTRLWKHGSHGQREYLYLTFKAWDFHRAHESVTKLQMASVITDANFPQPVGCLSAGYDLRLWFKEHPWPEAA
jgi:hypothetical protein